MTPGLLIAAPRSGSGKTTVTLGLLRAIRRRGRRVAGAKCGPDYIDPAFHAAASGGPSVNLDSWAMPPTLVATLAARAAEGRDLVVCEGAMGLFDGVPAGLGRSGASADIAAACGWPVVLVLDVSGQAQSAAATVLGCATYDRRIRLAGVLLNRVASSRHRNLVQSAVEALGIPVFGALPRNDAIVLPERHLGLVQAAETPALDAILEQLADFTEAHVDVTSVMAAADARPPLHALTEAEAIDPPAQRIAVAHDAAFSFIYPHVVAHWRSRGAELHLFSPLANEAPAPASDACWLPGGYPELHAGRLAAATGFLDGLRDFARGKPVHGECGGYMVLGEALVDASGTAHRMAGLLGVTTSFAQRKIHLGYREARLTRGGLLGSADQRLRGHEFHYASITDAGQDTPFAFVRDAYAVTETPSGSRRGRVSGSFFHVIAKARAETRA